jgi:ergothioneine biosynthesis protein EgtB
VKHLLSCSALLPVYQKAWPLATVAPVAAQWLDFEGSMVETGHEGQGFAFDNETPRHPSYLAPYALMSRLVTHGEWLEFMQAGGYSDARWWLSAGWDWVQAQGVNAPMYWSQPQGNDVSRNDPHDGWHSFTLHGQVPIDPHTPITHISYFEADAFARWKSSTDSACQGARLPTEAEWEAAVAPEFDLHLAAGNFAQSRALHPMPLAKQTAGLMQALGDVWEWTSSSYQGYPGYQAWAGAVGEYNGKFMVNQYVLRGGSCATPRDHIRATYRNFFPTDARWQFTGLRLAKDL